MENPVISVIIPAYNEENYIAKTLECFRNQETRAPFEIVVCDNNSTDATVSIAKQYADKVVSEKKQGIAFARNTGFKHSTGKYLVFADADTLYPADFIDKAYDVFCQQKYLGFYGEKYAYSNDDPLIRNTLKMKLVNFLYSIWGSLLLNRLYEISNMLILPGWCLCTPRNVFERAGGFDVNAKAHDDVQYSCAIKHLGQKKYIKNIRIIASIRRGNTGLFKMLFYHFNIHNLSLMFKSSF